MSCDWRRHIAATTAMSLVLLSGTPHMTSHVITTTNISCLHSLRPPAAVTFSVAVIDFTDQISHSKVADAVLI